MESESSPLSFATFAGERYGSDARVIISMRARLAQVVAQFQQKRGDREQDSGGREEGKKSVRWHRSEGLTGMTDGASLRVGREQSTTPRWCSTAANASVQIDRLHVSR